MGVSLGFRVQLAMDSLGVSQGSRESTMHMGGPDFLVAMPSMPAGIQLLHCHMGLWNVLPRCCARGIHKWHLGSAQHDRVFPLIHAHYGETPDLMGQ